MFRWFWHLLYGSEPVSFISSFGLEESVARLSAATGRSVFSAFMGEIAVGKVTASHVSLQRVIPMVGNSFKPVFTGSFVREGGQVVLRGRFMMPLSSRTFMTFWFGFIAVWTVLALIPFVVHDPVTWWFPFGGVAMFAAGIAFVRGGKWLARNDAAWLSQVIHDALTRPDPPGTPQTVHS